MELGIELIKIFKRATHERTSSKPRTNRTTKHVSAKLRNERKKHTKSHK